MQKTIYAVIFFTLIVPASFIAVHAQKPGFSATDKKYLRQKEDSLKLYAEFMITDSLPEDRMVSDSIFTRTLVRALQVKNSFYYPFDSVRGISLRYAPDSLFRIFTWNLQFDDFYSRQKGAIQMRTADGSLKLFPLRDISEFTSKPEDSVRTPANWIGAIYYNIIRRTYNNKNYYTLFGLDHNGVRSNKKWIEVLTFDKNNNPVFGGPVFNYAKDSIPQAPKNRISLEYKKDARILMNYVPELDLILVDHLVSESNEPDLPWTFVPDGDYDAYKWEGGKWVHTDKVFDYKIDMTGVDMYLGKPPLEDPILDEKGNRDEKKLLERSEKNKKKIDNRQ